MKRSPKISRNWTTLPLTLWKRLPPRCDELLQDLEPDVLRKIDKLGHKHDVNIDYTHFRLRERRMLENVRYPCPCIWAFLKLRQDPLGHLLLHAPHMRSGTCLPRGIDLRTYFLSYTGVECDDHIVHDRDIELPREVQDALRDRKYHGML